MEEAANAIEEEKETSSIIEVKALTKVFNNKVRAADGVTFTVDRVRSWVSSAPTEQAKPRP